MPSVMNRTLRNKKADTFPKLSPLIQRSRSWQELEISPGQSFAMLFWGRWDDCDIICKSFDFVWLRKPNFSCGVHQVIVSWVIPLVRVTNCIPSELTCFCQNTLPVQYGNCAMTLKPMKCNSFLFDSTKFLCLLQSIISKSMKPEHLRFMISFQHKLENLTRPKSMVNTGYGYISDILYHLFSLPYLLTLRFCNEKDASRYTYKDQKSFTAPAVHHLNLIYIPQLIELKTIAHSLHQLPLLKSFNQRDPLNCYKWKCAESLKVKDSIIIHRASC